MPEEIDTVLGKQGFRSIKRGAQQILTHVLTFNKPSILNKIIIGFMIEKVKQYHWGVSSLRNIGITRGVKRSYWRRVYLILNVLIVKKTIQLLQNLATYIKEGNWRSSTEEMNLSHWHGK